MDGLEGGHGSATVLGNVVLWGIGRDRLPGFLNQPPFLRDRYGIIRESAFVACRAFIQVWGTVSISPPSGGGGEGMGGAVLASDEPTKPLRRI